MGRGLAEVGQRLRDEAVSGRPRRPRGPEEAAPELLMEGAGEARPALGQHEGHGGGERSY